MKIEFGEFKVEFPYEKYLEKYKGENNPFETMFIKPNPEIFNVFLKNMSGYFQEFTKTMEEFAKMSKSKKKDE